MSEENLEIVRRSVAAFKADEEAWLEAIHPSMEWYPIEEGHTVSRGHEGARRVRNLFRSQCLLASRGGEI